MIQRNSRSQLRVAVIAVAAAVAGAACSSSTAPRTPGITILSGNKQSDTVDAVLAHTLVVQVATASGVPAAHQTIQFGQAVVDSAHPALVYVERTGSSSPAAFVSETTDASGKASVAVKMGQRTGAVRVPIVVPTLGYSDTARFTIESGHFTGFANWPIDANLYVGHADTLRVQLGDRYGNTSSDTVRYTVSGPGTVSGSIVTATGLGAIRVTATLHDSIADTLTIGVVPTGTLAGVSVINHSTFLDAFTLDDSHNTSITFFGSGVVIGGTMHWAPNGSSIAFDQQGANGYYFPAQIASVSLSGQVSILVDGGPGTNGAATVGAPSYSRDGRLIYYAKYTVPNSLWRVRPDGTGDSAVTMQTPERVWAPSPSPDGTQIAYIAAGYDSTGVVKVLSVSTGAATSLGVQASHIAWSPSSDVIAYVTPGNALGLVHASGAGSAAVLSPGPFGGPVDWSPDGQWLVVADGVGPQLDIVNASSAAIIPEFYINQPGYYSNPLVYSVYSPTWAPTSAVLQRVRQH